MKISFVDLKCMLANINARSELHGEERAPAGDLKFEASLPNDVLSQLHPSLKSALYHFDETRGADLADQGSQRQPGFLPHLRFTSLGGPLKWDGEMASAEVLIKVPGSRTEIALKEVKVNNLQVTPKDGGTVDLSFRVQAHPDEKQFGKLSTLVQAEVEVTVTPEPEEEAKA